MVATLARGAIPACCAIAGAVSIRESARARWGRGDIMRTTVRQAMSVRDEGRSLGAGLRRQAPNHLVRLGSRAPVVSVKEKARRDCVRYGSERRTRGNHR